MLRAYFALNVLCGIDHLPFLPFIFHPSWRFFLNSRGQRDARRVDRVGSLSKLLRVEVLPNIKIWRLAPNFDILKNFNSSQFSVEVRRTSTDEL